MHTKSFPFSLLNSAGKPVADFDTDVDYRIDGDGDIIADRILLDADEIWPSAGAEDLAPIGQIALSKVYANHKWLADAYQEGREAEADWARDAGLRRRVAVMSARQFGGPCRVPMWVMGVPAGHCDAPAFGPQLPEALLRHWGSAPYCSGPCCPAHGGPKEGEPIVFQDGFTADGHPMWCAVMPGFENLQESPSGFSASPTEAIEKLKAGLRRRVA